MMYVDHDGRCHEHPLASLESNQFPPDERLPSSVGVDLREPSKSLFLAKIVRLEARRLLGPWTR